MQIDEIRPDHFYRTRSGTICKVTGVDDGEDRVVSFIPYTNDQPGEADTLPAHFFTANVEEEVEFVDPQEKPLAEGAF